MINDQLKKQERSRFSSDGVFDYYTSSLLKKPLLGDLDQDNLHVPIEITEPVCERIFEQTYHRLVVVLASELTVLSYLNVFSVISRCKPHFLPSKLIMGKQ